MLQEVLIKVEHIKTNIIKPIQMKTTDPLVSNLVKNKLIILQIEQ